jgi:hypothetical protein
MSCRSTGLKQSRIAEQLAAVVNSSIAIAVKDQERVIRWQHRPGYSQHRFESINVEAHSVVSAAQIDLATFSSEVE